MNDVYISREKAIDAIEREFEEESYAGITAREAIYSVEIADVAPIVHGYWRDRYFHPMYACGCGECSICGNDNPCTNYCPNCGAKMDEEDAE